MISCIALKRFKKFENCVINLKPFSILMGENSCGKTSILQAINIALHTFNQESLITIKNSEVKVKKTGISAGTLPGMEIGDIHELFYLKKTRLGSQGSKEDGTVIEIFQDNNIYRLQIAAMFGGFNLKCLSTEKELMDNPTLQNYSSLFISGFVGLRGNELREFPANINRHLLTGNVSQVIRNLVLELKVTNPNNFFALSKRLIQDFDFCLSNLGFDTKNDLYVTAQYKESIKNSEVDFDFTASGSGFMQVLQILTPIYTLCPHMCQVVLLDEPDAHLHPNMQIALAKSLKEIQQELDIQIIISTHSPAIIKSVSANEVIPIYKNTNICSSLTNSEEVIKELSLIDNYEMAKSVISGKLIFLEDSNTDILEKIDSLLESRVFSGVSTPSVLKGFTKDSYLPYHIHQFLDQYLEKDVEVHYMRDSDGLTDEWKDKLKVLAKEKNVNLHILNLYEIESYILNPNLIYRALFKKYGEHNLPSIETIETKISEELKKTIELARYNYKETLTDCLSKTMKLLGEDARSASRLSCDIANQYEALNTYEELIKVGDGKKAFKGVNSWLNDDLHKSLSQKDILQVYTAEDITEDMIEIFSKLKVTFEKKILCEEREQKVKEEFIPIKQQISFESILPSEQ